MPASIELRLAAAVLACCAAGWGCRRPSSAPHGLQPAAGAAAEWRSYGGDPGGSRYSPLAEIDRGNVARLTRAWTYHTGELELVRARSGGRVVPGGAPGFQTTPLAVDGVLYLSTPSNRVIALDAESGRELWVHDPFAGRPAAAARSSGSHRGVAYWEGGPAERRILLGTRDGRLVSLDAATGRPVPGFGTGGEVDLREGMIEVAGQYGMSSPPAVYRDLVITGAAVPEGAPLGPSGDVRAFDVRTGRLVWRFHTVPRPGEPGHETWEGDSWRTRTGANVWSIMSVDTARGLVFLPVGSASYDYYGGDRTGQNLYGNSLVALDAATGKVRWYRQLVHHDLWDYDLPAQPALVTVRRGGREIPAVAQLTKMGFVYVLDRRTGEPVFGVEERPVPRSNVPGEVAWPTQPFPLRPAPLVRQTPITRADLNDLTPELRAACSALFDRVQTAGPIFTPTDTVLTLTFPGTLGGANWSGGSFDPTTGYFFANVNELGVVGLMERGPGGAYRRGGPSTGAVGVPRFWDRNQIPCQRPPWGKLHAIDLSTGEIAWTVPLGVMDSLLARGIDGTGAPNIGGSLVTAGGLVFIGATNDHRFRAFDARTGARLWEAQLDAGGHAAPMTFRGRRTGKQYVVIAAGGGGFLGRDVGDALVAFALPE